MPWFGLSRSNDDTSSGGSDEEADYYNSSDESDDLEKDLEQGNGINSDIDRSSPDAFIPSLNSSRSSSRTPPINDFQEDPIPKLSFRPLQLSDRQQIQHLHEQWFPVTYSNEFYDDLVRNQRLATSGDPLVTCAATLPNAHYSMPTDNMYCHSTQQQYQPNRQDTKADNCSEIIVGCVVGAFLHPSRLNQTTQQLLVPNMQVHSRLFYIMTLGTVEEYRGYGIATTLVQRCMEMVEQDPTCGALYLHVIPFNRAAIHFYEKLGFYRVCTIENYYTIDNQRYDCYLYAKYYHGNRGHRTLYKLVSGAISSLWHHLKAPLSLFSYTSR